MVKCCVVQFCTYSNKAGHTKNAKISKWHKVQASIIEICSSESEPKWSEVSRSNILLFVAVIFLPVAVATIQALPKANYSEV